MDDIAEKILSSPWVAVDTETDDDELIPACKKSLYGVSLAWGNPEHPVGDYWSFQEDAQAFKTFKKRILGPLFEREDVNLAWWNYKFDAQVLGARGLQAKGKIHDGMLLSYLIDENNRHALKACAKRSLGVTTALTYKESQREIEAIWNRGQKVIKKMIATAWNLYRDHRKTSQVIEAFVDPKWPLAKRAAFMQPPGLKKAEVTPLIDKFVRPKVEVKADIDRKNLFETYATHDAIWTLQLVNLYLKEVEELGLLDVFFNLEVPVVEAVVDIETRGVRMDVDILRDLKRMYGEEIAKIRSSIEKEWGEWFNPGSPDQLRQIFWGYYGIEPPDWAINKKNKKKGNTDPIKYASTDKRVLEWLEENHDIPLIGQVTRLRKLEKIKGTYIDNLLERAEADGEHRIHCSFNPTGTVNDRWSSNNPNLQNQPRPGTTEGVISTVFDPQTGEERKVPTIRRAYIPRDGYKFINADFSQIELRFLAHITQDPALLKAYRTWMCHTCGAEGETDISMHHCPHCWADEVEAKGHESIEEGFVLGEDIHWLTAVATGLVDTYGPVEGRYKAKNVNFGLIYGMFPKLLASMIGVSKEEAEEVHARFFLKYQKVRNFHHWVRNTLDDEGRFKLYNGRWRNFTKERNLWHAGRMEEWLWHGVVREATNSIIQGGAAQLMKMVVRDLSRDFRTGDYGDTGIVLQVHDEILVEYPEEREEQVKKQIVERMERVANIGVPIITDPEIKTAWAA